MSENKDSQSFHTTDMNKYAHSLTVVNPLRVSVINSAIEKLQLPKGSNGLDAGCGIGCHTIPLAESIALGGHVMGFDLSSELISYASK